MKMTTTGITLLILMACMSFTGCASFKQHNLSEVGVLLPPAPDAKKPSATFVFSAEADFSGKREHQENARAKFEAELIDVLRQSGYFATFEKGNDGKELAINVHFLNSGNPAALIAAAITGASLYTIPSWMTEKYEIFCKVKAADGKQHEYRLDDSLTMVQWLPMMFVFPFHNPFLEDVEVRKNIYKHLILKMQEDGVLPKADNPPKTN